LLLLAETAAREIAPCYAGDSIFNQQAQKREIIELTERGAKGPQSLGQDPKGRSKTGSQGMEADDGYLE
jgi:hypothetical protein